jgi:hypothetical protein
MKKLIEKILTWLAWTMTGGEPEPFGVKTIMPGTRVKELPWGRGKITYRIPNVVEQLRFHSAAKWYDKEIMVDGPLRTAYAIEAIGPYIVSIEGEYKTLDEVIDDRGNTDSLIDIALDIAGKRMTEAEKKP